MQRVRHPFAVAVKPAYDDPADPLTSAPGFFQKDPAQAPTDITADFANHVQEEICHTIEGLGEQLDDARDDQLAGLLAQGTFTPRIHNDAQATYSRQHGFHARLGRIVHVAIDIAWHRPSLVPETVRFPAPWQPAPGVVYHGTVHFPPSDFGTDNAPGHYAAVLDATGPHAFIAIHHVPSPGASSTTVVVGHQETRRAALTIMYRTTGSRLL